MATTIRKSSFSSSNCNPFALNKPDVGRVKAGRSEAPSHRDRRGLVYCNHVTRSLGEMCRRGDETVMRCRVWAGADIYHLVPGPSPRPGVMQADDHHDRSQEVIICVTAIFYFLT